MTYGAGMIWTKKLLMAGVALACMGMAHQAQAQEAEKETVLKPLVIGGDGGTGPVDGYVAKQTTTGSKSDIPLRDIPQSVSVIGRQELDDRAVVNKVDEALRYTPGVTAEPFGVDPDTDWFYIRGFDGTQTGVFLDGLNLYSYGFGGFQIDPYFLERVEVLKGPSSTLYGASNPGGILNMISKRPTGERLLSTEAGINSNGNGYVAFDAGNTFDNDAFSYRITGKLGGGDGYTDYSKDFRGGIMPQLTWERDDTSKLTVYGYYSALDQVHTGNGFYPYEGTVKIASYGRIDPKSFYGDPDVDSGTYQQTMLGYNFETELENGIKLTQDVRYGHLNKHEIGPYTYGYYNVDTGFGYLPTPSGSTPSLTRIGFEGQTEVNSLGIDNRASGQFDTGPVNHDVAVGLDYKYYHLNSQQSSGFSFVSVNNPDLTTPQGTLNQYLDQTLTQQQAGIYAQDQMRFGDGWIATLNGRYDVVNTKSSDTISAFSYQSTDRAFSGRVGLGYEMANGMTPYVSASTFFNPIVGASTATPIEPEEGYQYEAGIKYEPSFIDGVFTASVFQITKQNFTVTDPLTFAQSQIGEVRSTGVELEGKVNINENWRAISSFSYQDLEITKHVDTSLIGNMPYLIPKVTATAWLDYKLPENFVDGVSIAGGLRYRGSSWADYANDNKVPGALLADAAIRYEKDGLTASLNVSNLFDKRYVAGCQGVMTCGYGDSRTFTLKIGKTW